MTETQNRLFNAVIAKGYKEDCWHSSEIFAKHLFRQITRLSPDKIHFQYFEPSLGRSPTFRDRRLRFATKIPPADLIHLVDHSYGDCLLRIKTTKTVVTVHDLAFWNQRNRLNGWFRRRIVKGLKSATKVVSISDSTAKDLLKIGVPSIVIPPGADIDLFTHSLAPREPKHLLYVGSNIHRKGLDRLLQLLRLLPNDFNLKILGTTLTPAQESFCASHQLTNRIDCRQYPTTEEIRAAYCRAHYLVVPSRYEGFSLPVIEARLCGTMVIAHRTIPACHYLKDDDGLLTLDFDLLEATQQDLQALPLRKIISLEPSSVPLKNRAFFGWQRVAESYLALYRELLGEH